MTTIEQNIAEKVVLAVKELYDLAIEASSVQIQKTKKEFVGDLTVVIFPFVKAAKKSPDLVGAEIGNWIKQQNIGISDFNVIKGFLNLSISSSLWIDLLNDMSEKGSQFGFKQMTEDSELVMIEYSSPNTNKPLHLGHIRNNLLGYSISEIMKANGKKVVKTNIVNDRGIHICKSMLAWQKYGNGETPESSKKKGDHLVGDYYVEFDKHYKNEIKNLMAQGQTEEEAKKNAPFMLEAQEMLRKWEAGDKEVRSLWKKMNQWVYDGFDQTYKNLGVDFDKIYYESETYLLGKDKVEEGLKTGVFYQREDGSVWADLTKDGLDEKLLLRADGTSVYMTQDIGTASLRFSEYPIDKMIYVVGNEQNYHFQVLSILLDRLGFKWGKDLTHFSYGMVELPEGKMKSREGTVVDADDLMAEMIQTAKEISSELGKLDGLSVEESDDIARMVGLGALKYFILKVDPRKNMTFNPKESIDFNGNTGPFIQYTHARIKSLLRKAEEFNLSAMLSDVVLNEKEIALIQKMAAFEVVVAQAAEECSPAVIANYTYDLAKEYNQYYHDFSILKEECESIKIMRLKLSKMVAIVLKSAMFLLGIEMPDRM